MLAGIELVEFVRENEGLTQSELAQKAGYVKTVAGGKEQVLIKKFMDALLAARGVTIATAKRRGKRANYRTAVHKTGIILLGATYSSKWGLEPGDELEILLEDDGIRLVPVSQV